MIRDHVWRAPNGGVRARAGYRDRPCQYMNCRRSHAEHEHAASGAGGMKPGMRPGVVPQPAGLVRP